MQIAPLRARAYLPAVRVELRDGLARRLDLLGRRAGAEEHLPPPVGVDAPLHAIRVLGRALTLALALVLINSSRLLTLDIPAQAERWTVISWDSAAATNVQAKRANPHVREAYSMAQPFCRGDV